MKWLITYPVRGQWSPPFHLWFAPTLDDFIKTLGLWCELQPSSRIDRITVEPNEPKTKARGTQ